MSKELPQEFKCLVLFAALTGREFTKSELSLKLAVSEIERLNGETNLLSIRKKGASRNVSASEETLRWAGEHLNIELEGKSKAVLAVLGLVRAKTAAFLKANRVSFADFVKPRMAEPSQLVEETIPPAEPRADDLDLVRRAYLTLSGGSYRVRVRLKDLRKQLPFSRETQDAVFFRLISSAEADFYPEDDPMSRTQEDDLAALLLADRRRHVIYLKPEPEV